MNLTLGSEMLSALETYLLRLGPEYIFQVSGEPFTEPLFRPVSGPDSQAKPGMSNFMAETGPTELAHSSQGALREEDEVWAVDHGGENTHSLIRACPHGCPQGWLSQPCQPVIIVCMLDHDQ